MRTSSRIRFSPSCVVRSVGNPQRDRWRRYLPSFDRAGSRLRSRTELGLAPGSMKIAQILLNSPSQFFLFLPVKHFGVDGHFLAQEVQKSPDDPLASRRCGLLEHGMLRPRLRCLAHLVQARIVDDQQAALLKIA